MSRIEFHGTTNKNYVMVNTITFRLKDGREVTVDREKTEYTAENGKLEMVWKGCYLWDEENNDYMHLAYLNSQDIDAIRESEIVKVELEDDADADYKVNITGFAC